MLSPLPLSEYVSPEGELVEDPEGLEREDVSDKGVVCTLLSV